MKKATLVKHSNYTEDVFELEFTTEENFEFKAGQFVTIKIDDNTPPCFRAYSISSSPEVKNQFSTCIKLVDGGRGSNWLNELKEGDQINFIGPSGKFTTEEKEGKLFFIATGTGITPFKSIIEDELAKGNSNQIDLLFGLRHKKGVFYQDFFSELANKHQNFNFDITLSRPETEEWEGKEGRVTKHLEESNLDTKETHYFICGLKAMIDSVVEILKNKGVPEERIHFEKFD